MASKLASLLDAPDPWKLSTALILQEPVDSHPPLYHLDARHSNQRRGQPASDLASDLASWANLARLATLARLAR